MLSPGCVMPPPRIIQPSKSLFPGPVPSLRWWEKLWRFPLDENCWLCAKWLLHSTVVGLTSSPFLFLYWNGRVTLECSIHFAHTQQFSSNRNLTLMRTLLDLSLKTWFGLKCIVVFKPHSTFPDARVERRHSELRAQLPRARDAGTVARWL